jgi:amino acid transporter
MEHLRRRFSPLMLLLISINGTVGSAWLFAPLYAAKLAGSAAIFAWLIGGAMSVIIALTFAELSTLLPVAGGTTRISQLSHGGVTAFFMSWVAWLSSVTMPPLEVQAIIQYASTYFPSLIHISNNVSNLTFIGVLCATGLMLLLSIINVVSFKGLIRFSSLVFIFKIGVILLTIIWLIKTQFHTSNFALAVNGQTVHWENILAAVAAGGIAFAFTGFKHGVELAGESKKPRIAIPIAIVGSVICCLLLYLGLQIAFIGALEPSSLQQGWSKLSFAAEAGPFVGLAGLLGLFWLTKLLYADATVSPLGAGLIFATSTARIIYAMSKNGILPQIFSRLNKQYLPVYAIALNFVVGMFLFLPLHGWIAMVDFLVSAIVLSYAMGPIALLCLRKELPNQNRPFRIPFANTICFVAFYCCNLICYWTGWGTLSKLGIALIIGMLIFIYACAHKRVKETYLGVKALMWIVPYLVGTMLISYLGMYGGKQILMPGWDMLVIAVFSLVILYLAVKSRATAIDAQFALYKQESLAADQLGQEPSMEMRSA